MERPIKVDLNIMVLIHRLMVDMAPQVERNLTEPEVMVRATVRNQVIPHILMEARRVMVQQIPHNLNCQCIDGMIWLVRNEKCLPTTSLFIPELVLNNPSYLLSENKEKKYLHDISVRRILKIFRNWNFENIIVPKHLEN